MTLLTAARPSTSGTAYDLADPDEIQTPCQADPDLWFSDDLDSKIAAQSICQGCPFSTPCLNLAMDREGARSPGGRYGIWGGLSPDQRAALALRQRRGGRP